MPQHTGNEFTPIHNPYIVGNPIKDSKMFFGREEDFAYVRSQLTGSERGGLVVLCGARRSGKTSILFQILDGRLGDDFVPVLIDMQSMTIGSDADFLKKLTRAIVTSDVVPSYASIEQFVVDKPDDPYAAFDAFVAHIIESLGGRKLVLTFDEYELFETNIDSGIMSERILQLLSGIIEHHGVFVVFTGSDKLEQRDRGYWNIFLSKSQQKRISFLHIRDTMRLITQPVAGEVEYDDDVKEEIAGLTAGQPFYTQVLCRSIIDRLNDERKHHVTLDDLEHVVTEVVENPLPQMIFHWNTLADTQRLAMAVIAERLRAGGESVSSEEICEFAEREDIGFRFDPVALNKSLESLFHDDLVVKDADADRYCFKMGLWRRWITRMHSVWQVIDEIDQAGGPEEGGGLLVAPRRTHRSRTALFTALAVVVVAAVIGYQFLGPTGPVGTAVAPVDSTTLSVRSTPPQATILVNGRPLDLAPFERRVPAGSLRVSATLPNYRREERDIVAGADEKHALDFVLQPLTGNIRVTSTPPGADIVVDGRPTGLATPAEVMSLSVVEQHEVEVRLASYHAGTIAGVRVFADSTVTVHHDFSRRTAIAAVTSTPPGASVLLDGREVGRTPTTLRSLAYGTQSLGLRLAGYADTTVTMAVNQPDIAVEVTLRELPPGTVEVQVPFGGGDIAVDGRVVREKKERAILQLSAGSHTITVTYRDGTTRTDTVRVVSGESRTVRFEPE